MWAVQPSREFRRLCARAPAREANSQRGLRDPDGKYIFGELLTPSPPTPCLNLPPHSHPNQNLFGITLRKWELAQASLGLSQASLSLSLSGVCYASKRQGWGGKKASFLNKVPDSHSGELLTPSLPTPCLNLPPRQRHPRGSF